MIYKREIGRKNSDTGKKTVPAEGEEITIKKKKRARQIRRMRHVGFIIVPYLRRPLTSRLAVLHDGRFGVYRRDIVFHYPLRATRKTYFIRSPTQPCTYCSLFLCALSSPCCDSRARQEVDIYIYIKFKFLRAEYNDGFNSSDLRGMRLRFRDEDLAGREECYIVKSIRTFSAIFFCTKVLLI